MLNQAKYPIYVISKGRADIYDSASTILHLQKMKIDFKAVVEPQELKDYENRFTGVNFLTTPFSNLGQGGIPARNFSWDHATQNNHEKHWILDDNIHGFYIYNNNAKIKCLYSSFFNAMEKIANRYKNIALCGPNYHTFVNQRENKEIATTNTRIYSCILIDNNLTFRWRGRYNEDTDLSIRALKQGYCTILFNTFLQDKTATMTMKGGNTDELYKQTNEFDGRLEMAKSLYYQHPDCVKITKRWGRWQHHVDYSRFKNNQLILKEGVDPSKIMKIKFKEVTTNAG